MAELALQFQAPKDFGHSQPQCQVPGCTARGRYSMLIAGYYVYSDSPLGGKELYCRNHRDELTSIWQGALRAERAVAA